MQSIVRAAKARGGKWKESDCERTAEAFARVAKENAGERNAVARARYNEGVAWSKCGDDAKARSAYRSALQANPRYAPAKVNLAELAARGGNPAAAYRTFLEAFLSAPENLDANYNLAVIFEQKARSGEQAPEELKSFWRKIKLYPKTAFDLAELHLRMVLAKSSAGSSMRAATLNLKAYTLLALLYFKQSAQKKHRSKLMLARLVITEAQKVFKKPKVKGTYCKAAETPSDFDIAVAQLRNLTGLVLLRRKLLVEAMYKFEAALKCDANFVEAHMNRAAIALGFRGYWIAHDSFKRVLKQKKGNVDAIIGLGVAYRGIASAPLERGRPQKPSGEWYKLAIAQYKKALEVNPNATDAIFNLGHLYMDYVNNIKQAKAWYEKYLAKSHKYTAKGARKAAKDQIAEIAYQKTVLANIGKARAKMKADMLRRKEEEERRRAAAMNAPRAMDPPRTMDPPRAMGPSGMPAGMSGMGMR